MLVLGNCTFSVFYHYFVFGRFVFCLLLIFDFLCCIVIHTNCFTFISDAYDWVNSLQLCPHHCLYVINCCK